MTNSFFSEVVKLRGKIYEIKELSANRYDKSVKLATKETEDESGAKREEFDSVDHQRILVDQCVSIGTAVKKGADGRLHLTDGKPVDIEELRQEGNRVWRTIVGKTLSINLDDEPEEEIVELEGEASAETGAAS